MTPLLLDSQRTTHITRPRGLDHIPLSCILSVDQEASDTEMTPPCPTTERSNPFDDLAPPGAMSGTGSSFDAVKIDIATHNPHMYEMQRRGIYPGDQDLPAGLQANAMGGNVDVSG
jgi:hypothetical protein